MSAFLPCPFCGNSDINFGHKTFSDTHDAWFSDGTRIRLAYFCSCSKCCARSPGFIGQQTEAEAMTKWNQRTPDLYEALKNLLDFASEYHSTSISALGRAQEALAKARGES